MSKTKAIGTSGESPLLYINNDAIIFQGKPDLLNAEFVIVNPGKERIRIREMTVKKNTKMKKMEWPDTIRFRRTISSGSSKTVRATMRLPKTTAAGTYRFKIDVGGVVSDAVVEVHENFRTSISPRQFITQDWAPGETAKFQMTLFNKGNVPYKIPNLKHAMLLDSQYMCKAQSRSLMEDAKEGMLAFVDGVAKKVHENYAFWVGASLAESGKVVAPGERIQLNLTLKLPKNLDQNAGYYGDLVIAAKLVIRYELLA